MRKVLLVFPLLILGQFVKAQVVLDGVYITDDKHSVLFQGVVNDGSSKQSIDGVAIYVFGSDGTNIKIHTDSYGNFKISLKEYIYKLTYEKEGYQTLIEEIRFAHVPDTIEVTKYLVPKK
jgi:hypothetical protein